jgi:F-type H+-transporting ATPase subunit alpha
VGSKAQTKAMRSVASSLKLDLAAYWELQAFAQFASDLDKATQAQLSRGNRIVEVLKQELHSPMPLEQQVMIIYVATNGYLDDVAVEDVRAWERGFYTFMNDRYPDVPLTIAKTRELPKEMIETLQKAIVEFKGQWKK